jgi:long-chain fatty acid transport protein
MHRRLSILIPIVAVGAPAAAIAGGFAVAEQSAVAGGTAGAGTARADDAGAAWYNPAALADGGGLRVGVGVLAAMPSLRAQAADGAWRADSESSISTPPHLYASFARGPLAAGVSVGVPYGGGVTWPEDWSGRHEIISSRLEVFRVAPFVAWGQGRVRLAAGAHFDAGRMRIHRALNFVDTEGEVRLDMSGTGIGAHAAAWLQARSDLAVGVTYKSRTTVALEGGAAFEAPDAFAGRTMDQTARTTLRLPDRLATGVLYRRGPWAALADLELTLWSVNQRLLVEFDSDDTPDAMQLNGWRNTVALRAGGEYALGQDWVLRGGAFFDPSPALSENLAPSSPDATRVGATAGASFAMAGGWAVDAFYEYMHLLGREAANPEALEARYGGNAQLLGLGVRLQR